MRKENVEKHFMSIGFFSVLEKCPAPFIMRHAPGQGRVAPPASGMSHEVPWHFTKRYPQLFPTFPRGGRGWLPIKYHPDQALLMGGTSKATSVVSRFDWNSQLVVCRSSLRIWRRMKKVSSAVKTVILSCCLLSVLVQPSGTVQK